MVTKFTDAINKQDAAALQKMVTADAVLIDEDGHFDPIGQWITKLTATGSKTLTVLGGRGLSPLKVSEMGDTAWAAFNYNLKETVTPRGQSTSITQRNQWNRDHGLQEEWHRVAGIPGSYRSDGKSHYATLTMLRIYSRADFKR